MTSATAPWKEALGEEVDAVDALALHLRARAVLLRLLQCLDAKQIPALVVKGALLAYTLYASPVERPIRDIDLRVRPRDLRPALRALHGAGLAGTQRFSHVAQKAVLLAGGVDVDVETSVGPPFMCRLSVDAMLARAVRSTAPLGFPHWQPELHDHALLLALNVLKDHVVDAASWSLRDLVLIATMPAFDPRTLAERAREHGATTAIYVVASYLTEHGGGLPWQRVTRELLPSRTLYAREMVSWLRRGEHPSLARRIRIRACADNQAQAVASIAAMGAYALERSFLRAKDRARARLD